MKKRPLIFGMIKDYASKSPARFHTPGHKGRKIYGLKSFKHDITELSVSDCLADPSGVIKQAEVNIANTLGCKKSFILTDGATSGILAMIYAVKDLGNRLLMSRSSHQSVYNACRTFGLEPVFYDDYVENSIARQPVASEIQRIIEQVEKRGEPADSSKKTDKIAAVFITAVDYYGFTANLQEIKRVTDACSKLLLVDNAHGSHIRFTDPLNYAGNYAAAWVDSYHKTMPTLTQGAILGVNSDRYKLASKIADGVNIFRTSSPSYPIMSSVEYAVTHFAKKGKRIVKRFKKRVEKQKTKLQQMGFAVLDNNDYYKLVIDFEPRRTDSYAASAVLEDKGVFPEMSDGRYMVLTLSPYNTLCNFRKLRKALSSTEIESLYGTYKGRPRVAAGARKLSFLGASRSVNTEEIELTLAVGGVSAVNVGLFPPCYPMIVAGETITREAANALLNGPYTFGLSKYVDDKGREHKFINIVIPDEKPAEDKTKPAETKENEGNGGNNVVLPFGIATKLSFGGKSMGTFGADFASMHGNDFKSE